MNEANILSVGDRVKVANDNCCDKVRYLYGKVIRIHFDSGEIVVMYDRNGAEHRHHPQNIEKVEA